MIHNEENFGRADVLSARHYPCPLLYSLGAQTTAALLAMFHLAQWNPANWIGVFIGVLSVAIAVHGVMIVATPQRRNPGGAIAAVRLVMLSTVAAITVGIVTFGGSLLIPQITLQLAFLLSILMAGLTVVVVTKSSHTSWNRVIRGFRLREVHRSSKHLRQRMCWGGLFVKEANEPLHFAIVGNTGTGKSTWLEVMMTSALSQVGIVSNVRGIVFDAKRDLIPFLEALGVPYKILNPLDERSAAWNIGHDIRGEGMAREFAALIVEGLEDGKQ